MKSSTSLLWSTYLSSSNLHSINIQLHSVNWLHLLQIIPFIYSLKAHCIKIYAIGLPSTGFPLVPGTKAFVLAAAFRPDSSLQLKPLVFTVARAFSFHLGWSTTHIAPSAPCPPPHSRCSAPPDHSAPDACCPKAQIGCEWGCCCLCQVSLHTHS